MAFVTLGLGTTAGPASAAVFSIDEFTVTENGQTYWRDTVSDGAPPVNQTLQNPTVVDVNL